MDPTAAPVDLVIGGKVYKAYPFRDRDHEEFNKWVRREYLRRIVEVVGDDDEMKWLALREAMTMVWITGPGREVATTVAGLAKMACLLCRNNKFTESDLADDTAIRNTIDAFSFLHNFAGSITDKEEDESVPAPKEKPLGN